MTEDLKGSQATMAVGLNGFRTAMAAVLKSVYASTIVGLKWF